MYYLVHKSETLLISTYCTTQLAYLVKLPSTSTQSTHIYVRTDIDAIYIAAFKLENDRHRAQSYTPPPVQRVPGVICTFPMPILLQHNMPTSADTRQRSPRYQQGDNLCQEYSGIGRCSNPARPRGIAHRTHIYAVYRSTGPRT